MLLMLGWSAGCAQLLGDVDLRDPMAEPAPQPPVVTQQTDSLEPTGSAPPGLPRLCDTGQTRCLGGLLEECDAEFGNWKVVDSCATPDHPMIDHVWRERLALSDRMVELRRSPIRFAAVCGFEGLRRTAIGSAKMVRDRLRSR